MRAFLLWATIPALTLAAVLPSAFPVSPVTGGEDTFVRPSVLELVPEFARVKFSVPCPGCLGGDSISVDDGGLLFDVQVLPSDRYCGVSALTVNGQVLGATWDDIHAQGQGRISTLPERPPHNLDLSWEIWCLFGPSSEEGEAASGEKVAQVVTLKVHSIDGTSLQTPPGFTMSFTQQAEPQLLRLSPFPDSTGGDPLYDEDWRNPSSDLLLGMSDDESSDESDEDGEDPSGIDVQDEGMMDHDMSDMADEAMLIEADIQELKILEQQARMLDDVIREKRRQLISRMNKGCKHLKEEIDRCDGVICVIKAIVHHTKQAMRLLYLRFKPFRGTADLEPLLHSARLSQAPAMVSDRLANCTDGKNGCIDEKSALKQSWANSSSHTFQPGSFDLPDSPPGPVMKILSFWAYALGLTALISFLRRCCSARKRGERQARRDERRRARLYRRAARKAAWRAWWERHSPFSRSRRHYPQQPTNWDEKRARVMEQEAVLESHMQSQLSRLSEESAMRHELRAFRRAHGVVDALIRAEEGDASPLLNSSAGMNERRYSSGTGSLPAYRTDESGSEAGLSEPPAYEEDEGDASDVVVDGFREYTPSSRFSDGDGDGDWTPESSIIDVSPRPSAETLRTAEEKL